MPAKRNDAKAEAMYRRYKDGLSLVAVGKEFGMCGQGVHSIFKRRNYKLRSRSYLPFVMFNGNKYSLRTTGYYSSTTSKRGLLHRKVWEHHNGPIPDGMVIHHKDGDKGNNDISNLEMIELAKHSHGHLFVCPQCGHKMVSR